MSGHEFRVCELTGTDYQRYASASRGKSANARRRRQSPAMAGCCRAERRTRPSAGDACCSERRLWRCWVPPPPRAGHRHHRRRSTTSSRNSSGPAATANWPAAAATAAPPQLAQALTAVASERSAHAQALADEIVRARRRDADATTDNGRATPSSAPPPKPPTTKDVIGALRRSRDRTPRELAAKPVGLPRRAARLDRRRLHRGLHGRAGPAGEGAVTSAEPTPTTTSSRAAEPTSPSRPPDAGDAALFDAVATEHAIIYGYGMVSAHSTPDVNDLVSTSMAEHRDRREEAIAMLSGRSVDPPLPAAGYQLPIAGRQPDRRRQSRGADGRGRRGRVAGGARAGDRPSRTGRSR